MNKNKKYILIALLASLLFTVTIGFSMWIILSEQTRGAIQSMGTLTLEVNKALYAGETWTDEDGYATVTYTHQPNESVAAKTVSLSGTFTVSKTEVSATATPISADVTVTFVPSSRFVQWVWGEQISFDVTCDLNAVAYIGSTYYTTVDAALSTVANATTATTVNVIPSGDYDVETVRAAAAKTIANNFTIQPSVTLRLSNGVTAAVDGTINIQPDIAEETTYNFTRVDDGTKEGLFLIYSQFSGVPTHSDAYFRTDWCENIVTVKSGVSLTNNGTITIDAVVTGAAGGAPYSSIVFGNYSKISMQSGGKITNTSTGTINCYGFIDEATPDYDYTDNAAITDATVQLDMQAGTLNTVFTISEHRGGNVFMGMAEPTEKQLNDSVNINYIGDWPTIDKVYSPTLRVFAFHRFFIQSVSVNTKISSIALIQGEVSMYANGGPNQANVQFIGRSAAAPIFALTSYESYAMLKYTHNQDANKRKIDVDIYGDAAISPLALRLTIKKAAATAKAIIVIDLKTKGTLIPISHYYDIAYHQIGSDPAVVDLSQQEIKILPGASVTIGQGVTLNATRIAIYESNKLLNGLTKSGLTQTDPANSGTFTTSGIAQKLDYPDLAAGKLTVNGTLNASAVGGPVIAGTDNAVLNITGGNTVVSPELLQTYDTSITVMGLISQKYAGSYFSTNADSTLTAKGDQWNVGAVKATNATLAIGQYVAKSGAWTTPTSVTITFNSTGGSAVASQTYTTNSYNGVTLSSLPTPTKAYYEFAGWFTDSTLQTAANGVVVHSDTTLYAKWIAKKYVINYSIIVDGKVATDESGGSLTEKAFSILDDATASAEIQAPSIQSRNMTFVGWSIYPDKATSDFSFVTSYLVGGATKNADGVYEETIYAIWQNKSYDVILDVWNDANYGFTKTTATGVSASYYPADVISNTILGYDNEVAKQYRFDAWYVQDANGNYVEYRNGISNLADYDFDGNAEITLYANWVEKDHKVTFNVGVGSAVGPYWVNDGEGIDIPAMSCDGFAFLGWYDAASGGNRVGDAGESYTPSADVTLYARWEGFTVTYNANGGSCDTASATYNGTALTLPTPTRTGYTFQGWYTAASGGNKVGDAGKSYIPSADVTLYARWQGCMVTYNPNGGKCNTASQTYEGTALILPTPTGEEGWTFKGWYTAASGGKKIGNAGASYTPTEDITLYAQWDSSCLVEGTLITMADGTQKPVEDLKIGDMILVFNHVTGKLEAAPLIFNTHSQAEAADYNVLYLNFSDGSEVKIVASHGFFDMTLMKYVYITEKNYEQFIGHEFYALGADGSGKIITLTDAHISREYVRIFCPVTYFHMNSFANGLLNTPNIPGDITGLVNYFEYDSDLKYNEESMAADIEKYGLYSYEDFSDYISYEAYLSSPAVYLKVSVGKGMMTYEEIIDVILYLLEGSLIDSDISQ